MLPGQWEQGGTIINARGSSIHETSKFPNMEIEPEKEMVMILAKDDLADQIVLRSGSTADRSPGKVSSLCRR